MQDPLRSKTITLTCGKLTTGVTVRPWTGIFMMRIEVAGAGAGKTTGMASRILGCEIPAGKVVYCVAFTNAAADNIRSKLVELSGSVSDNIKVSTIHSFLYSELIKPYYHLLFNKSYQAISVIRLPNDNVYRNAKIRELEGQALLHQTVIPQRARWVVDKKTKESARVRALRAKVIALFAGYCHNIFVDEAQDIDKDMKAPDVESIDNLRPSLNVSQSYYNFNPRSTLGTVTEISHRLRTLFALVASSEECRYIDEGLFSRNNPASWCPDCQGTGEVYAISLAKLVPDPTKKLSSDAILYYGGGRSSIERRTLLALCEKLGIDPDTRYCDLTASQVDMVLTT